MNFLELLKSKNLIAAHRGARSIAPENTMRSLKATLGHCDFIEIDIQLSRDGIAIVMHDETLLRTTNISELDEFKSRKPYNVADFTLKELSSLDYGSWFDGDTQALLTLSQTLEFIKKHSLFLNIEIKDMHNSFSDSEVVSTLIKELKAHHLQSRVLISSFRHHYLPLCKERCSSLATAALVDKKHPKELLKYLASLRVDAYHMSDRLVDAASVTKLREAGYGVNVYTINNRARADELFEMGVNAIFTDELDIFAYKRVKE